MIISDTYAIFWREMKRYRKSKSGVIIRLIQPADLDCSYGKYFCWNSTVNTIRRI